MTDFPKRKKIFENANIFVVIFGWFREWNGKYHKRWPFLRFATNLTIRYSLVFVSVFFIFRRSPFDLMRTENERNKKKRIMMMTNEYERSKGNVFRSYWECHTYAHSSMPIIVLLCACIYTQNSTCTRNHRHAGTQNQYKQNAFSHWICWAVISLLTLLLLVLLLLLLFFLALIAVVISNWKTKYVCTTLQCEFYVLRKASSKMQINFGIENGKAKTEIKKRHSEYTGQ